MLCCYFQTVVWSSDEANYSLFTRQWLSCWLLSRFIVALRPEFDIGFLDRIGHNPHYPITDGWPHLVAETIHTIQQTYQQPVIGVGHSFAAT